MKMLLHRSAKSLTVEPRLDADMIAACCVIASALVSAGAVPSTARRHELRFPDEYTVTGRLILPHSDIEEPFAARCDGRSRKCRIDYYDGAMKTFQLGSELFRIHWTPNPETHAPEENCRTVTLSDSEALEAKGVLPDPSEYEFARSEYCYAEASVWLRGVPYVDCDRYEWSSWYRDHASDHVLWVAKNAEGNSVPVRYRMSGKDDILKSQYDEYEVIYDTYSAGPVDSRAFEVTSATSQPCLESSEAPEPSVPLFFNPIQEFVRHNASHVDEYFAKFKKHHGKDYRFAAEERQRRHNFRHNVRYVNSMNRRNLSYALKLNERADSAREELGTHGGCLRRASRRFFGRDFSPEECRNDQILPDHVDWRLEGAVTPVKNQGTCGSCWSFAVIAHLESQYFLNNGKENLTRFSEQQLVDCSWDFSNTGCSGGSIESAFSYVKEYGLFTDEQYGPYREEEGKCRDTVTGTEPTISTLEGFNAIGGKECLRNYIALKGPIAVAIDASSPSFVYYSHGVYKNPACGRDLNHAVLAIGYGELNGEPYWLIKNSWGDIWGSEGFMLISQENNTCGIEDELSYADL
ncbi:cathepsin S [Galendromus occidentalis]|uniref:Cathepsin S n=1 Tax=Galendromus occidentalis TaxID=34638 RepID=A0AAJ7L4Q8_9ACAR|nr:cathepsin S [Galendromus occidentalis]